MCAPRHVATDKLMHLHGYRDWLLLIWTLLHPGMDFLWSFKVLSLTPCYPWSARDVLIPVDDIPPQGPNWSLLLVYNYLLSSTSQIKELSTNIASPVSFNCATHSHSGTLPWPPFPLPTTLGWSRAWGQHILITYLYSLRKVLLSQLVLLLFYFFEESSWLKQLKEERVWFVQGLNFQRLDG